MAKGHYDQMRWLLPHLLHLHQRGFGGLTGSAILTNALIISSTMFSKMAIIITSFLVLGLP